MNCSITRTERGFFVQITLSERNIEAIRMDPRPITRQTHLADGTVVTMLVACEDDVTHYNSPMRDESVQGQAGALGRFDEEGEGAGYIPIPK